MPNPSLQTPILIVGGGPVGLTLAMDLAARGIDVTVAETRYPREAPSAKCNHISARSMEIFRRLGVAPALRNAGLPTDYPNDCSFRTTTTGLEITRIPIPCRRDRYTATGGPDTWWPTPEPPHRLNQIYMEPILFDHAVAMPKLRLLNRTQVEEVTQDEAGVRATARNLDTDETFEIRSQFLVGCDGGRSMVRRAIGAQFVGDPVVQRVQSTFIRAPGLIAQMRSAPAWGMISLNPRRSGTLYAVDGRETFIVHNYLKPEEEDFEAIDRDWSIRTILGVDDDFQYEVIQHEDWIGRRLVADKFRDRRIFICGDAAHIWVPYAGYGMNAGVADAANLAWLLAAHLQGWASVHILDAYERERLPITEQVSIFAMNHAHQMIKNRRAVPLNIEEDGPGGDAVRAEFGQALYDLNVQQYCCGGLNFGYYYDQSPIIAYDGAQPPPYTMYDFTPSTAPGCRTPHFWLANGRSLYDALGADYALLRFDPAVAVERLMDTANARGFPLKLVDVNRSVAPGEYETALLISRPDQHVAWRGNAEPDDVNALLNLLCGVPDQGSAPD
ncbi:MAG: FAD-dependent oxidoreductase [Caldilineaceae bacterium]